MLYVGIDPGGTTGWVVAESVGNPVSCGQTKSVTELIDLLNTVKPAVVVIEDFRVYGHKAKSLTNNDLPAPRVIGAVEAWCDANSVTLVKQPAAHRKVVSSNLLDLLGFLKMTRGMPHARDAAKHLVRYLWNQDNSVVAKKLAKKIAEKNAG